MTATAPSLAPSLNVALFVRDHVPARIRALQAELRTLEEKRALALAELRTLTETAVLNGIELFPQQGTGPAARASGPGGTETPPGLAGTDGVSPASRAA